jgi:hypothetical protein
VAKAALFSLRFRLSSGKVAEITAMQVGATDEENTA